MLSTTRRALMLVGLGGVLPSCSVLPGMPVVGGLFADWPREGGGPVRAPDYARIYGSVEGEPYPVRAFAFDALDPGLLRAEVAYAGREAADTIVIEPRHHRLFLVEARGRATRYGIAVGPEARGFSGRAVVAARRAWPEWEPAGPPAGPFDSWARLEARPASTRGRPPGYVAGGPRSPRGARALYLASGGEHVTFVVHGTPQPEGIGGEAASGCIALIDQDAIDLYRRTREGTQVYVAA